MVHMGSVPLGARNALNVRLTTANLVCTQVERTHENVEFLRVAISAYTIATITSKCGSERIEP